MNQKNRTKLYAMLVLCTVIILINAFYISKIYQPAENIDLSETTSVSDNSDKSDNTKAVDIAEKLGVSNQENSSGLKVTNVKIVCNAGELCNPPVISEISEKNLRADGVDISWKTSQLATTAIFFSTSTPFLKTSTTMTVNDPSFSKDHAIDMGFLKPNTTYKYVLQSVNSAGFMATSSVRTFTTLGPKRLF